jgi:hypothetical protein
VVTVPAPGAGPSVGSVLGGLAVGDGLPVTAWVLLVPVDVPVVGEVAGGVVGEVVGAVVGAVVGVGAGVGAAEGAVVGLVVGAGSLVREAVATDADVDPDVGWAPEAASGGGVTTPGGTVTGESSVGTGTDRGARGRTGWVASASVVGVTRPPRTEVDTLGAVRTEPPEPRVGTWVTSSAATPDPGWTSMRCWMADTTAATVRITAASTVTTSAGCGGRRVDADRGARAMAPPH